jgi:hypothetical protein
MYSRIGCLAGGAVSSANTVVIRSRVLASVVKRITRDRCGSRSLSASAVVHLGAGELLAYSLGERCSARVVLPAAVVDAAVVGHVPESYGQL